MTLEEKKRKYPNLYALAAELVRHKNAYYLAEIVIAHTTANQQGGEVNE